MKICVSRLITPLVFLIAALVGPASSAIAEGGQRYVCKVYCLYWITDPDETMQESGVFTLYANYPSGYDSNTTPGFATAEEAKAAAVAKAQKLSAPNALGPHTGYRCWVANMNACKLVDVSELPDSEIEHISKILYQEGVPIAEDPAPDAPEGEPAPPAGEVPPPPHD